MPRITGRDVAAPGAYADVTGATDADPRLKGEELDGGVFTTSVDGHTAQLVALVTHDARGLIATVDMYGRPSPEMLEVAAVMGPETNLLCGHSLGQASPSPLPDGSGSQLGICVPTIEALGTPAASSQLLSTCSWLRANLFAATQPGA